MTQRGKGDMKKAFGSPFLPFIPYLSHLYLICVICVLMHLTCVLGELLPRDAELGEELFLLVRERAG